MTEEEFYHLEEMALDNYMAERVNEILDLLAPIPFNELPTLGDWLDA